MRTWKIIIIIVAIALLILIAASYYFTRGKSEQFVDVDLKITQDTFFHVKSYRLYQPLSIQNGTITLVLDSPRIAYDTIPVPAPILLSAAEILKMQYCLYNLKARKIIGSPVSLK